MKHFIKFPGGLSKALTLSYDDGVDTDIRLIEIMRANGLKGAFNINSESFPVDGCGSQRIMDREQLLKAYSDSGMEIACHSCTHPYLERIPAPRATYEIMKDRDNLEKLFGCLVRGMALPFGTYNDEVLEIAKYCGMEYCRITDGVGGMSIPENPLLWRPTCHHNHPELFNLLDRFLAPESPANFPKIFYLWGHSYEFEGDNNWDRIEEFARRAGGHENVWYATNIEIIDYLNAARSLIFSADGFLVKNPTCQDVWFYLNGNATNGVEGSYVVRAGETVRIK